MHQLRTSLIFLLLLLLVLVSVPTLATAQVEPRLQAALSAAAPNETIPVIIRLSEQVNVDAYRHLPKKERRRQLVQELRANSGRSQKGLRQLLRQAGVGKIKDLWHINALAIDADPALIAAIAARSEVASVSLNGMVALPPAQSAAAVTAEWNLAAIGVFDLWQELLEPPGTGITVATIDTGVDGSHPNLSNWRGNPGGWFDPVNSTLFPVDNSLNGHGTAVMGILAGNAVGGAAIGVAPEAAWIAANPFAGNNASYLNLHSSFLWALDPDGDPVTDDVPDVVNNSWALDAPGSCLTEFQADIDLLKAAGIGVVFAAGNSGPAPSSSQSPANNLNMVAVGATDSSGLVASFSSRGPSACPLSDVFPNLVAPGENIYTALPTLQGTLPFSYGYVSGTSFSSPHIAGIMALLLQAFPNASIDQIETAMTVSATDLGPLGPDNDYGHGLVNAMKAYRYLNSEPILAVYDPVAPENDLSLDFGSVTPGTSSVQEVVLRNAGSMNLQIIGIDGLLPGDPFTVDNDPCSNAILASGESCTLSLRFSPQNFIPYTASLTISSSDSDPDTGIVVMTLSGIGNTPPPAASLLLPADNAVDVVSPVIFRWTQAADSDGDIVTTSMLLSESVDFMPLTTFGVIVATASATVLFAGCGLFLFAALLRRHSLRYVRILQFVSVALLVLSCGGGGTPSVVSVGSISCQSSEQNFETTYSCAGLISDTTYYWKVQSVDSRKAVTESAVRTFTTAP